MLSRVLLLTTLALFLVRCSGSSTPDGDGHDDDDDGDESLVFSSCDTTPHGGTDERECYTAATVPFGGTCALTTQTRTCANGAWSPDFPESCLASCTVAAADACGITANGDSESRTCYGAAVVPFGSTCTSAEHTRTCANGTWTPDWPSCAYLSCEVAPAAACDGQPHGTVENRTCYSAASVPPGQTCGGTNQSRTCDDGDWSSGYASCPYLTCVVEAGARCGSTLHDAYESRACYAASAVAFANECTFAWQDRLCDDGGWSPDYSSCANLTCSVGAPPDYSSEHGWLVDGTGCTPSTDEREYDAIAVGSGAVYVSYRLDLSHVLHKLDAVTGAGLDSDQGNGTGGAGVVADATGVYSAGWVNQHGYLEKRDLATLDHIAGFGTYATGVRRFDNEPILRLECRDSQLWLLVERYTASGYDWYLTKVGCAATAAPMRSRTQASALRGSPSRPTSGA